MIYVMQFVLTNYVDQSNPWYSLFDSYVELEIIKEHIHLLIDLREGFTVPLHEPRPPRQKKKRQILKLANHKSRSKQ